jgi:hypothetical protein
LISLDHFTWWNPKGYTPEPTAYSSGINTKMFTSLLMEEPVPIEYLDYYGYPDFRAYVIINNENMRNILFTTVSWIPKADDLKRQGLFNHTAIIDKDLLQTDQLSLFEIDSAMKDFKAKHSHSQGAIDALEVPEKSSIGYSYYDNIANRITQAAMESLAYRLISKKQNKAIVRCGRTTQEERFKLAAYIFELLTLNCGIRPVTITTEPPRPEYVEIFDVAVTETEFEIPRDERLWLPHINPYEHVIAKKFSLPKSVKEKIAKAYD